MNKYIDVFIAFLVAAIFQESQEASAFQGIVVLSLIFCGMQLAEISSGIESVRRHYKRYPGND